MRTIQEQILICAIAALHVCWGLRLLISGVGIPITPLWTIRTLIPSTTLRGVFLISAGTMVISTLMYVRALPVRWRTLTQIVSLIPQQALLIISAWDGLRCAHAGAYADGTVVPNGHWHIFMDQSPLLALAAGQMAVMMMLYAEMFRRRRGDQ